MGTLKPRPFTMCHKRTRSHMAYVPYVGQVQRSALTWWIDTKATKLFHCNHLPFLSFAMSYSALSGIPNAKRGEQKIRSGPRQRGTQSELAASPLPSREPKRGRKCYVTPAFSGIPNKGEQNQKWLFHLLFFFGSRSRIEIIGGRVTKKVYLAFFL